MSPSIIPPTLPVKSAARQGCTMSQAAPGKASVTRSTRKNQAARSHGLFLLRHNLVFDLLVGRLLDDPLINRYSNIS